MKKEFLFFLLFFSTLGYTQYNNYVPQIPINAMRDVSSYKQKLYQERSNWIQATINNLNDLNNSLLNEDELPSDFGTSKHKLILNNYLAEYVNSIKGYDFSDDYIFNSIQKNFKNIQKYYVDYFNYVSENYIKNK